ncbi:hypothetical protein GCM10020331_007440 [Ectobacillus funiculus]
MTGAQMPAQCDAVVMLELTKEYEKKTVRNIWLLNVHFNQGTMFHLKAKIRKKGNVLVPKGTYINPGVQALLATFGYANIKVAKKSRLLVFMQQGLNCWMFMNNFSQRKIRNSNAHMVQAQIERAGATPIYAGKLIDDFEACYEAISKVLEDVDILVTTGGVSVGDFDYLPAIYEQLGAKVLFNKIAMRPGSVTTVAELNGKLLFGLSGNPSACYVGFELLVRPVIKRLLHSTKPHVKKARAVLQADFPKSQSIYSVCTWLCIL